LCSGGETCTTYKQTNAIKIYELEDTVPGKQGLYWHHSIEATGVVDLEAFKITSDIAAMDAYIAVAQYTDGRTLSMSVDVYGLSLVSLNDEFVLVASIPTEGAKAVVAVSYASYDYLLIAQEFAESVLVVWEPGLLEGGKYVQVLSFPTIRASSVRHFWSNGEWMVMFSNLRSTTERCLATQCHGGGQTYRSEVQVWKAGAATRISEFIPYPRSVNDRTCVPVAWSLSADYANITLSNTQDVAVSFLKPGMYIRIDEEVMRIIDAPQADKWLQLEDGEDTMIVFQNERMAGRNGEVLDLENMAKRWSTVYGKSGGYFLTPEAYREAWGKLSSDKARVQKFSEILGEMSGESFFAPLAPASADLDMDGKADFLMGKKDGTLGLFLSGLNATVTEKGANPFEKYVSPSGWAAPALADLNGDGLLDLVVGESDGRLRVFYQRYVGTHWHPCISIQTQHMHACTYMHIYMLDLVVGEPGGRLKVLYQGYVGTYWHPCISVFVT
jgi:hypothetical protein